MSEFSSKIAKAYLSLRMADEFTKFEQEHKQEDELIFRISEADRAVTEAYNGYVTRMNARMESLSTKINELKKMASSGSISINQRERILSEYESLLARISKMQ